MDHVTRLQGMAGVTLRPHATSATHPEQELPARMTVPVGTGVRREMHHADIRSVVGGERRAEPDFAREPAVVSSFERSFGSSRDLHLRSVPSSEVLRRVRVRRGSRAPRSRNDRSTDASACRVSSWITLVLAMVLALGAIALFPESGGDQPPLASLALIGTGRINTNSASVALYTDRLPRLTLRLPSRLAASLAFAFV